MRTDVGKQHPRHFRSPPRRRFAAGCGKRVVSAPPGEARARARDVPRPLHARTGSTTGRGRLVVNGDMVDFMSVMILPDGGAPARRRRRGQAVRPRLRRAPVAEEARARDRPPPGRVRQAGRVRRRRQRAGHRRRQSRLRVPLPVGAAHAVEWLCGLARRRRRRRRGARRVRRAHPVLPVVLLPARTWSTSSTGTSTTSTARSIICCTRWPSCNGKKGGRKSRVALSVAHAGMRYFANQLPRIRPAHRRALGLSRLHELGAGPRASRARVRLCYFYGLLVWRVVELWYALIDRDVETERARCTRSGCARCRRTGRSPRRSWSRSTSCAEVPVTKQLWKLLGALFIDRVLLGVGGAGRRRCSCGRAARLVARPSARSAMLLAFAVGQPSRSTACGSSTRRPSCALAPELDPAAGPRAVHRLRPLARARAHRARRRRHLLQHRHLGVRRCAARVHPPAGHARRATRSRAPSCASGATACSIALRRVVDFFASRGC